MRFGVGLWLGPIGFVLLGIIALGALVTYWALVIAVLLIVALVRFLTGESDPVYRHAKYIGCSRQESESSLRVQLHGEEVSRRRRGLPPLTR